MMLQSDYFIKLDESIFIFLEYFGRIFKEVKLVNEEQWQEIQHEFQLAEDEKLLQFIEHSLNGSIPDKYQYVINETITEKLAKEIEKVVGFSVEGYQNKISASRVKHIVKRHGEDGYADNSLEDVHDIARIGYIVQNYDNLVVGKENVREYKNKDNTEAKTVVLQKRLKDEFYYIIEAVPNSAAKTLYIVSVYKNKKNTLLK